MYLDEINNLICKVNPNIVDFSAERSKAMIPTQVSSEFLTNKEQGDWAEKTLLNAINQNSKKYVAVKYGRNDDIIAGDKGFKEFYENYQEELDSIGKRPDILIFDKEDFSSDNLNISNWSLKKLDEIVPKAKCGIEVRSSAFLMNKYEAYMVEKNEKLLEEVMNIKKYILSNYSKLLRSKNEELYKLIVRLNENNANVMSYRSPGWHSSDELNDLSKNLKELKTRLSSITKRTFLSITPKVEDLKVVYNWIKRYNVAHFYVQVFFDNAYGISFKKILELISDSELEGKEYFLESDVKNQNKTTIKIHANKEANILKKIDLPKHYSEMKELGRGRLLFFVKFKDSLSIINKEGFENLFGFELI